MELEYQFKFMFNLRHHHMFVFLWCSIPLKYWYLVLLLSMIPKNSLHNHLFRISCRKFQEYLYKSIFYFIILLISFLPILTVQFRKSNITAVASRCIWNTVRRKFMKRTSFDAFWCGSDFFDFSFQIFQFVIQIWCFWRTILSWIQKYRLIFYPISWIEYTCSWYCNYPELIGLLIKKSVERRSFFFPFWYLERKLDIHRSH